MATDASTPTGLIDRDVVTIASTFGMMVTLRLRLFTDLCTMGFGLKDWKGF